MSSQRNKKSYESKHSSTVSIALWTGPKFRAYRQDTCNISKLTQTEENKEKNNADWTLPLLKTLFSYWVVGTAAMTSPSAP